MMDKATVITGAREFAQQHNPQGIIPFPFADVIHSISDLVLTYLETTNAEISGAIYLDDDVYQIIINSNKPVNRQYFTLAHEIAHYCLHRDFIKSNQVPGFIDFGTLDSTSSLLRADTMPTDQDQLELERQANTFAAELIMPEQRVREFFELNTDVQEIANAFRVSVPAMAVRLEKLGLV